MIIAIPDIHGDIHQLNKILNIIKNEFKQYKIIFLGDYVDRGNYSYDVLKTVEEYTKNGHIALMGNHEEFLLDFANGGGSYYLKDGIGGSSTIKSFNKASKEEISKPNQVLQFLKREDLLDWLLNLPFYYIEDNICFTHAPVPDAYWNNGIPDSDKAKHHKPFLIGLGPKEEAYKRALGPHNMFSVCGHVIVDYYMEGRREPVLFEEGIYLDCGAGKREDGILYAAVFENGKLTSYITPDGKKTI